MSKVVADLREWRELQKRLAKLADGHVRVGILGSKGGHVQHDGISVVELASIHEFGSPKNKIPERSFIRGTFKARESDLKKVVSKLAKEVVTMKITHRSALETLGLWGATEIKKFVTVGDGVKPRLKQATIDKKGSSRPLVDTGRMINAVSHEVKL